MGVSSLGAGSSILTQNVLDQLRAADDAQFIKPVDLNIAAEKDKQNALKTVNSAMSDLQSVLVGLGAGSDYDKRKASVSGDAISVSASSGTASQSFSLEVTSLATKDIKQSGSFGSKTDTIANGSGSLTLSVGDSSYNINYDGSTTLEDLAKAINKDAKDGVSASIVQVATGDYRLFLSSAKTGSNQAISITDNGSGLDNKLTSSLANVQSGTDASFKYNGIDITRHDNQVDDLIDGISITLNKAGTSNVAVSEDRSALLKSMDDFVAKYNSTISQLDTLTKASQDASVRGIFSNESTIKDMKRDLKDMLELVGGGNLASYGFSVDDSGKLKLDKDVLNAKIDENPANAMAFLSGGTYTNPDSSTTQKKGAFNEMLDKVDSYLGSGKVLDGYKKSTDDNLAMYNDRKDAATKRLDARYDILKKQYAAYDAMIAKLNSASQMFNQMIATQNSAQ